jgi:hypothetical protein
VSTSPRIENRGGRFRLLTGIVVVGGAGRLLSAVAMWPPTPVMLGALVMELVVTPGLALWQYRVARLANGGRPSRTKPGFPIP